jgi:hypothetical protein
MEAPLFRLRRRGQKLAHAELKRKMKRNTQPAHFVTRQSDFSN